MTPGPVTVILKIAILVFTADGGIDVHTHIYVLNTSNRSLNQKHFFLFSVIEHRRHELCKEYYMPQGGVKI